MIRLVLISFLAVACSAPLAPLPENKSHSARIPARDSARNLVPISAPSPEPIPTPSPSPEPRLLQVTDFVTEGSLHLQGSSMFAGGETTIFTLDTTTGPISLRTYYSNANWAWTLSIHGYDVSTAQYIITTTPGTGEPSMPFEYEVGYDAARKLAYQRIAFNGSFHTAWAENVEETIGTPTAITTHAPTELTARSSPRHANILLLGDSQNDITCSTTELQIRPSYYILNTEDLARGTRIENLAIHGHTFMQQQAHLAAFLAAFPEAVTSATRVIVDMGWNNFPPQYDTEIHAEANGLLDFVASNTAAPITLMIPSAAKNGTSAYGHLQWQIFRDRALAGGYPQAAHVSTMLVGMDAGLFGGEENALHAPYSADGLHYSEVGKRAKGALLRAELVLEGVL